MHWTKGYGLIRPWSDLVELKEYYPIGMASLRGSGKPSFGVRWHRMSLVAKFSIAGAIVVLIGTAIVGFWVSGRIRDSVNRNAAAQTVLYMDSFIAPIIGELASGSDVSASNHARLDKLFEETPLGKKILSLKVWLPDNKIAYARDDSIVNRQIEPPQQLAPAWQGKVVAAYQRLGDVDDIFERGLDVPLLEVYAPIRAPGSERIIAVAELYEKASALDDDLFMAQISSWAVVGLVSLAIFVALIGIVRQGNRTIERQRGDLNRRINQLSELLVQNEQLRQRIEDASREASEFNEYSLSQIGVNLHDGPAQYIALAILRLDGLANQFEEELRALEEDRPVIADIQSALGNALREMRTISSDLMIPQTADLSFEEYLEIAVRTHERRTNTRVARDFALQFPKIPRSIKLCLYRLVQVGLNNAFRHAGGNGQQVQACHTDGEIAVEVRDAGPGFTYSPVGTGRRELGLQGMRNRIIALSGTFEIDTSPGSGTKLRAKFQLEEGDGQHGG